MYFFNVLNWFKLTLWIMVWALKLDVYDNDYSCLIVKNIYYLHHEYINVVWIVIYLFNIGWEINFYMDEVHNNYFYFIFYYII